MQGKELQPIPPSKNDQVSMTLEKKDQFYWIFMQDSAGYIHGQIFSKLLLMYEIS